MSMYLQLLHGRNHPDEEMNDWGFNGPLLGPLDWARFTYGGLAGIGCIGGDNILDSDAMKYGLFCYDGKYYGDLEFVSETGMRGIPVPFDTRLAVWIEPTAKPEREKHEDEGG